MSGQAGGGGADGDGESKSDPWISSVANVSAFLAGFSLATVVVITDGAEHFKWPGYAILFLTIASVLLILAAQESRRGARYYKDFNETWRAAIWMLYHVGITALLVALALALAPRAGASAEAGLRWAAMWVAVAVAIVQIFLTFPTIGKWINKLMRNLASLTHLHTGT